MKFKVGDKVLHGNFPGKILEACKGYQRNIYLVDFSPTFDIPQKWIEEEALKLFPEKQDVGFGSPMPVPGKFYKTRCEDKVMFVGKDKHGYFVYQEENGEFETYERAYSYVNNGVEWKRDIVGEWVDEVVLPAVEIKQWAVVQRTDKRIEYGYSGGHTDEGFKDIQRGTILKCSSDKEYLKRHLEADEELVELTGTLPERKVTNG